MKTIVATSVVCSIFGVVGLLALSAMTVVPEAEQVRRKMLVAGALFAILWMILPLGARWQFRRPSGEVAVPVEVKIVIAIAGAAYVLLVLLCVG